MRSRLSHPGAKWLASLLAPQERVIDVTGGVVKAGSAGVASADRAWVIVTDQRLIVRTKRRHARTLCEIPFSTVIWLTFVKSMTGGYLAVATATATIEVEQMPKSDVERIARNVRERSPSLERNAMGPPTTPV